MKYSMGIEEAQCGERFVGNSMEFDEFEEACS
jgi:hypothetical protein